MATDITVTFMLSGETRTWTPADNNLLQFAERLDIEISSGCQYGECGTCLTELVSGEVEYLHETGIDPEPNTCLPCSCRPKTSIVLRA